MELLDKSGTNFDRLGPTNPNEEMPIRGALIQIQIDRNQTLLGKAEMDELRSLSRRYITSLVEPGIVREMDLVYEKYRPLDELRFERRSTPFIENKIAALTRRLEELGARALRSERVVSHFAARRVRRAIGLYYGARRTDNVGRFANPIFD